jgi:hypothetical protein
MGNIYLCGSGNRSSMISTLSLNLNMVALNFVYKVRSETSRFKLHIHTWIYDFSTYSTS